MLPLNPFSYIEHCEVLQACSPADPRKVAPSLPAPVRPSQRVDTRNAMQWQQVATFLADRVVNP